MIRKIALNRPGIWGMSAKMAPSWCLVSLLGSRREDRVPTRRGKTMAATLHRGDGTYGTKRSRNFHGVRRYRRPARAGIQRVVQQGTSTGIAVGARHSLSGPL